MARSSPRFALNKVFADSELCKFGGFESVGRDRYGEATSRYPEQSRNIGKQLEARGLLLGQAVNGPESPD